MAFEYQQDLEQDRFLPASLEDRLVAMLARMGGVIACGVLAACWISLITWSAGDPSLTQSNGGATNNLLGLPGAVVSDLLLQTFGFAAVIALLAPSLWAIELVSAQRVEAFRTKITYYPLTVLLLAGALSSLPVVISWPLHNGFGGILGDGLYGACRNLAGLAVPKHSGLLCAVTMFVLGGTSLCYASGGTLRSLAGSLALKRGARSEREPDVESDRHFDERPEPAFGRQPDFEWDRNVRDSAGWREEQSVEGASVSAMKDTPAVDAGRDFDAKYAPGYGFATEIDDDMSGPADEQSPFQPQFEPAPLFIRKSVEQQRAQAGGAIPHTSDFVVGDDIDFDQHTEDASAIIASRFAPNLASVGRTAHKEPEAVFEAAPFPVVEMPPAFDTRAPSPAHFPPVNAALPSSDKHFASRGSAPWGDDEPRVEKGAHGMGPGPDGVLPLAGQTRPRPSPDPIAPNATPARAASGGRLQPKPGGTTMMGGMTFHRAGPPAYRRPSLNLLKRPSNIKPGSEFTPAAMRGTARLLEDVLADFGIKGEIRDIKPGPVVTLFEFEPARGVKSSRVIGLADDIARSMSATSARIGIVPGRNVIGIELPNSKRETVLLRELFEAEAFRSSDAALPIALGKAIGGDPIVADLARMPHLLVAGTTGSGKSVGVNAMILSLLYRYGPDQCRFLMIDPKMLELSIYNDIPHLLCPVVTDANKAVNALNWVVGEMEERYKRMSLMAVRNVDVFNNRVHNAKKRGEMIARTVQTGFDRRTGKAIYEHEQMDLEPMPYIVVVIDEFADLMSVAGKDVEAAVQRLAQMARAAGIHLIMATQRPSVDVITGTIKANFPTRISFKVASKVDSRTILNEQGAEQLLGLGDMLYSTGSGNVMRVHGPFVADEEVEAIAKALRESGRVNYVAGVTDEPRGIEAEDVATAAGSSESDLYDRAVAIVLRDRKASTSYLQRRLSIGYNRAADLIERMERDGLISPPNAVNKREILAAADSGE